MNILLLNGPNLNLLGTREPDVYGATTLDELVDRCTAAAQEWGVTVEAHQSNHEGDLIDRIHEASGSCDGIVFNPGAFTHYSYALHDAITAVGITTVEVHLSNVRRREPWRRVSVVAPACERTIYGRGTRGYTDAIRLLVERARRRPDTIPYGSEPDQVGDLRVPTGSGPHPTVVLFHGGLWRHEWGRDLMEAAAVALVDAGWATWNVEFRRLGGGGGWLHTLHDAGLAVDKLTDLASHGLDLGRVTTVGHSAGGHLALWAAARDDLPAGSPFAPPAILPARVVALAPLADLSAAHAAGVGDGAVAEFLDADPPHERYRWADPAQLGPWRVPTSVIHGERDKLVPPEQATLFADAVGGPVTVSILADTGHFDLIEPRRAAWEAVIGALS